MSSRLHKIGTIYSRAQGLLRTDVMKESEKPLWYDVYTHFPPKYEPKYSRETPEMKIREIFFEEDVARAKLHKKFSNKLGLVNLSSGEETNSQKLIKSYNGYISQGMSEDEALAKITESFEKSSGIYSQINVVESKPSDKNIFVGTEGICFTLEFPEKIPKVPVPSCLTHMFLRANLTDTYLVCGRSV